MSRCISPFTRNEASRWRGSAPSRIGIVGSSGVSISRCCPLLPQGQGGNGRGLVRLLPLYQTLLLSTFPILSSYIRITRISVVMMLHDLLANDNEITIYRLKFLWIVRFSGFEIWVCRKAGECGVKFEGSDSPSFTMCERIERPHSTRPFVGYCILPIRDNRAKVCTHLIMNV